MISTSPGSTRSSSAAKSTSDLAARSSPGRAPRTGDPAPATQVTPRVCRAELRSPHISTPALSTVQPCAETVPDGCAQRWRRNRDMLDRNGEHHHANRLDVVFAEPRVSHARIRLFRRRDDRDSWAPRATAEPGSYYRSWPIPAASPDAAALLLCRSQDPIAWLAPDESRSPGVLAVTLARFPRNSGASPARL